MKNKKSIVLLMLLLSGCFPKNHDLHFTESLTFNYLEEVDACQLVKQVDMWEVKQNNIKEGKIEINDLVIECPDIDTSKLGEQSILYKLEKKEYPLLITVADTQAPTLIFKSRNIEVEQYDYDFNILDTVSAIDNYDTDVIVGIDSAFDINVAGSYRVRLKAVDNAGNVIYDEIRIKVLPREKPEPEKEIVYVQLPSQPIIIDKSQQSQRPPENQPIQNTQPISKPEDRFFSFSEYANQGDAYQLALNACKAYGASQLQAGYKGFYTCDTVSNPETGEYTGYQITFK